MIPMAAGPMISIHHDDLQLKFAQCSDLSAKKIPPGLSAPAPTTR